MKDKDRHKIIQTLQTWQILLEHGKGPKVAAMIAETIGNLEQMQYCGMCGEYHQAEEMSGQYCNNCTAHADYMDAAWDENIKDLQYQ